MEQLQLAGSALPANFTHVDRPHGGAWLHTSGTRWVVEYSATRSRGRHFQAYQAIGSVPAGRDPWTVNNRRIGASEDGFDTLEAACAAVEAS